MLARAAAAELALAELGGLERGTLTVQASQVIASDWLPRHLVAFRRAYPQVAMLSASVAALLALIAGAPVMRSRGGGSGRG